MSKYPVSPVQAVVGKRDELKGRLDKIQTALGRYERNQETNLESRFREPEEDHTVREGLTTANIGEQCSDRIYQAMGVMLRGQYIFPMDRVAERRERMDDRTLTRDEYKRLSKGVRETIRWYEKNESWDGLSQEHMYVEVINTDPKSPVRMYLEPGYWRDGDLREVKHDNRPEVQRR